MIQHAMPSVAVLHQPTNPSVRRQSVRRAFAQTALALALSIAAAASNAAITANTSRCSATFFTGVAPTGVTIKSASVVAATATVPEYCSVLATVAVTGNTDDFLAG